MAMPQSTLQAVSTRQFLLGMTVTFIYWTDRRDRRPHVRFLLEFLGATVTTQIMPATQVILCDDRTLHSPLIARVVLTNRGNVPVVSEAWVYTMLYYKAPCNPHQFSINIPEWLENESEHGELYDQVVSFSESHFGQAMRVYRDLGEHYLYYIEFVRVGLDLVAQKMDLRIFESVRVWQGGPQRRYAVMSTLQSGGSLPHTEVVDYYGHVSEAISGFSAIFLSLTGLSWHDRYNLHTVWTIGPYWHWRFIGQDTLTLSDEDE